MSAKSFCKVAAVVFALIALGHVARLMLEAPVQIGASLVPIWVSWLGAFVAGGLSVWGFRSGS